MSEEKQLSDEEINAISEARKQVFIELFKKFDGYACIRNDKWYIDFKKEKLEDCCSDKIASMAKNVKTEFFTSSVMEPGFSKLKVDINAFCATKAVKNISMQEASDMIICMVNYEE